MSVQQYIYCANIITLCAKGCCNCNVEGDNEFKTPLVQQHLRRCSEKWFVSLSFRVLHEAFKHNIMPNL